MEQNIYKGKDFKFSEDFKALREALIADFFKACPEYKDSISSVTRVDQQYPQPSSWKIHMIKSAFDYGKSEKLSNESIALSNLQKEWYKNAPTLFPTAYELANKFGDACQLCIYAVLAPNSVIRRHTGKENRDAQYVRVHIPLIIPEGDIGFEVLGEEVYWDDVFAFNNQKLHSAWNNTNEKRLILLVDLTREACGLPPVEPWTKEQEDKESLLYPCTKGEYPTIEKV